MKEEMRAKPSSKDLNEYFELVRIPSVGADPMHLRDCTACAMFLKERLREIGAEASLYLPLGRAGERQHVAPPVLFGERKGAEGAPTVLFYGHYDVQPADPVDEWETPPFEPTLKDGRVYARGAQDDKGQLYAAFCGLRDFLSDPARAAKAPTIKFLFEGQEESGSPALAELIDELKPRLKADILFVCDTGAGAELRPAIVAGMRGVAHFTVRLTGPARDLHSGEYGGVAPNPVQGLARLVASLHAEDGSVAVAGFHDGIEPPTEDERRAAEAAAQATDVWATEIGCAPLGGEEGLSETERVSFRPTIEVNGIHGGYGGPGAKTVIASSAVAKLSMRLVPGQHPGRTFEAVKTHLEAHVPRGMTLAFEEVNTGTTGFRLPLASPVFALASSVLEELDPRGPVFVWDGASIPIVSLLREASGAAPLLVGWGQPGDRIHAPNESYGLDQFAAAAAWSRAFFSALSD